MFAEVTGVRSEYHCAFFSDCTVNKSSEHFESCLLQVGSNMSVLIPLVKSFIRILKVMIYHSFNVLNILG